MFLEVELKVKSPEGVEQSTMQDIVNEAEKVCPYSRVSFGDGPTLDAM
jgi:organic hydroperoxide reductase OsmC/OhrA